jgi:hypothetical protein
MADGEQGSGQDLNIEQVAREGSHAPSTQTPEGGSTEGTGDGKPTGEDTGGTGTEGGSGSEGEGDFYTPDADGKYTHPETKAKVDHPDMIKYLRDKFGASTAGAQDLLTKNATLEGQVKDYEGKMAALEKEKLELTAIAEGKNPEGLKGKELQDALESNAKELAVLKEDGALDKFERSNPLATGKSREALKALARANPSTDMQKLWDDNLKAGAEAEAAAAKAATEARDKGASDQGTGTSTREVGSGGNTLKGTRGDTGITLEEFNALPVAKRGALIEKYGIQ